MKEKMAEQGISNDNQTSLVQYALGHSSSASQKPYTDKFNQKLARKTLREINKKRHDNAKTTDSDNNA